MKFKEFLRGESEPVSESLKDRDVMKAVLSKVDFTEKEYEFWMNGGSPRSPLGKIVSLKLDMAKIDHENGSVEDMTQFGIDEDDWFEYLDAKGF